MAEPLPARADQAAQAMPEAQPAPVLAAHSEDGAHLEWIDDEWAGDLDDEESANQLVDIRLLDHHESDDEDLDDIESPTVPPVEPLGTMSRRASLALFGHA